MATEGQPRRVLIAEDEALIRLDLAEMLAEEGYVVVGEAGDGETAVRLAEESKPDLVILDIKMPIMDGIAAAELIAGSRLAPVIAMSRFAELAALEAEVASLGDRLETRKAVERAKGILMSDYGMSEPEAFRWIQRNAMDHRMTMRDVAEKIVVEGPRSERPPTDSGGAAK